MHIDKCTSMRICSLRIYVSGQMLFHYVKINVLNNFWGDLTNIIGDIYEALAHADNAWKTTL